MCSSSALKRVKRLRLNRSFKGSAQADRCDQVNVGALGLHKDACMLAQFCRLFSRMDNGDLGMVLVMAQKMARRKAV
jgi:hypothetical protein